MGSWGVRRRFLAAVLCAGTLLIAGCFGGGSAQPTAQPTASATQTSSAGVSSPPRLPSPSPSISALPSPTPLRTTGPEQTYTVEVGDTLAKIAQKYYGDESLWRKLYDANKEAIGDNPDAIKVGTQIKIPPKE